MCLICSEYAKNRMNILEVNRALAETDDEKHGIEVLKKIYGFEHWTDVEYSEMFNRFKRIYLNGGYKNE